MYLLFQKKVDMSTFIVLSNTKINQENLIYCLYIAERMFLAAC